MANVDSICAVHGCDNQSDRRGYCTAHYMRFLRYGHPEGKPTRKVRSSFECSIDGCNKPASIIWCRLCAKHYARLRRHGTTQLPDGLTRRGEAQQFIDQACAFDADDCLIWPFSKNFGYGVLNDRARVARVHRVVCQRVHGEAPSDNYEVAHSCGVRACCNPKHLRWATRSENQMDRVIHGTSNRGSRQWASKLTEEQAAHIKTLASTNSSKVAEKYGVSPRTIRDIWNGKTWAWL